MMFALTLDTASAAFGDDPAEPIALLLREAAERVRQGERAGTLRDVNGNTMGGFALTGDGPERPERHRRPAARGCRP